MEFSITRRCYGGNIRAYLWNKTITKRFREIILVCERVRAFLGFKIQRGRSTWWLCVMVKGNKIQDEDPIPEGKPIIFNGTGVGERDKASTSTDIARFVPIVNSIATSSMSKCEHVDVPGFSSSSNGHLTLRTSSLKINSEALNGIATLSQKRVASSGCVAAMDGGNCNGSLSLQMADGSTPKISVNNDEQDEKGKLHVVQWSSTR